MKEPLEVDFKNKERCISCRKQATRLCDVITGVSRYAGHPPKIDGKISNVPMESTITCDNPICDKCTIKLNEYMDICPDCYKKIQAIKQTKKASQS